MNRYLFCFILLVNFAGLPVMAQTVSGDVRDSVSGEGLKGASVYINNSSIGVVADDGGRFLLNPGNITAFDLIVSCIGYEAVRLHVTDSGFYYHILLKKKPDLMAEVTVYAADKDGWNKWGTFFLKNFIGTTRAAKDYRVLNPKTLRFFPSDSGQVLTVFADEPVSVDNHYLGYHIDFELTRFKCDYRAETLYYEGYPKFTQLKGTTAQKMQWEKHRRAVYEGSVMHFLRTVYTGSTAGSGFQIRLVRRELNRERARVQPKTNNYDLSIIVTFPPDSVAYFQSLRMQPVFNNIVAKETLAATELIKPDSGNVYLDFDDFLQVIYKGKKEESGYGQRQYQAPTDKYVTGMITLIGKLELITASGQFFPPQNVKLDGYWSWSEKLSNLLPIDYQDPVSAHR